MIILIKVGKTVISIQIQYKRQSNAILKEQMDIDTF